MYIFSTFKHCGGKGKCWPYTCVTCEYICIEYTYLPVIHSNSEHLLFFL